MDKKVFLLDKDHYTDNIVSGLTEKDLEEWVAENDYEGDNSIIKIDANGYEDVNSAIEGEFSFIDKDDYYIFSFGF